MAAPKVMMNQEKTIIMQLTHQNEDIFTGIFSISGANILSLQLRTQLGSAVGQPAEYDGTHQPDLPCLIHAHQQHQCNLQDADQGGRRDIGACLC